MVGSERRDSFNRHARVLVPVPASPVLDCLAIVLPRQAQAMKRHASAHLNTSQSFFGLKFIAVHRMCRYQGFEHVHTLTGLWPTDITLRDVKLQTLPDIREILSAAPVGCWPVRRLFSRHENASMYSGVSNQREAAVVQLVHQ